MKAKTKAVTAPYEPKPHGKAALRIRGEITTSILLFVPSHGLISLLPWEPTASVADLETAAVNSPRILTLVELRPHGAKSIKVLPARPQKEPRLTQGGRGQVLSCPERATRFSLRMLPCLR